MLKVKYGVNNMLSTRTDITEYRNELEARFEDTGKLVNELRSMGMRGCIDKTRSLVDMQRKRAVDNGIFDYAIKIPGVIVGSIHTYTDTIYGNLDKLEQEHRKTGELIKRNIDIKRQKSAKVTYERQQTLIK